LRYASVCAGIEAATVAWRPLGWQAAWFSEIEPFCCALLKHHYPEVPNLGDFRHIESAEAVDVLIAGTPCQDFSVAGLRKGLDGARGRLTLECLALVERVRPRWVVWENVPGVLSSDGGRAFGIFLGALGQIGYGFAYRILDAQYFGVPQRRRRVFLVGYLGDWRRAAAVLFERACLSGDSAPSRKTGKTVAGTLGGGSEACGWRSDTDRMTFVPELVGALRHGAHMGSGLNGQDVFYSGRIITHPLRADGSQAEITDLASLRSSSGGSSRTYVGVRRLTPVECERLQGFPDNYTLIPYRNKPVADGPRYRALGNSMAVPVIHWIGQRIQMVEDL
jgi:DNA (cytosine-5)-methyltransferase 1